jgi:protein-S-isoprenylcysteine O-methyltransferase Ste14
LRFWRAHTSILPFRPSTTLVQGGAYRVTRNPMYLGFALVTVASGLLFDSLWPIVLLPPVLYLVQRLVILPEERYLRRRFGAEYDAYTTRVRRWL